MRPRSSVEVFTDKTGNGGPDGIVPKIESAYHRTCGVSVGYGFEQCAFQVPELCNITSPDRCARNTADSSMPRPFRGPFPRFEGLAVHRG